VARAEAREAFRNAAAQEPNDAQPLLSLAMVEEAASNATEAVSMRPSQPPTFPLSHLILSPRSLHAGARYSQVRHQHLPVHAEPARQLAQCGRVGVLLRTLRLLL
jgi:hypothetical protein